MKKISLSLMAILSIAYSFAQTGDYKKRPALGVHFTLTDFKTAADLRSHSLSYVLNQKNWATVSSMNPGLAISYWKGLTNTIDFSTMANFSFLSYPIPSHPENSPSDKLAISWDADLNFKMLPDKYLVSPYVTGGIGVTKFKGYYSGYMPLGLGLQFNLFDDAFVMLNSQYRVPVTSLGEYHLFYSLGFLGTIGKKKEVAPPPPPPPPPPAPADMDKDGVVDSIDACPTVPGPASLNGCPDSDGDGILDKDDACPNKAGIAKYKGCPIPDTDGDGINDEEDKCPTVAGLARYQGCPIPDTDGDGINDEEDKCPTVAGIAENFGCPKIDEAIIQKIEYAAKNVYFASGKFTLLSKSFKPLNDVAKIMNDNPDLKLDISGHTDNTGDAAKNQTLSENRAKSVLDYLVKKGVDTSRITSAGYGQDQPIADNNTAAGRAKNRRVEIKVRNY